MENNEDLAFEQSLKDFENLEMETQHSYASALNSGNFFFLLHKSGEGNKSLRTLALIVSAHPYCARNSLPRHALSTRAVGEMWRYIALVGTLVSMHGFNSLKCSVTPYFLLINHFLCQLSTF